jgi:asparagine synthase (glutamine-hydrolysing)
MLAAPGSEHDAARSFSSALELARRLKGQLPNSVVQMHWVHVASFPRENATGARVLTDPKTGNWIFVAGTWFHADGMATGAESGLLQYYQQFGPSRLARELEGFFTIVVADAIKQELVIITDLVGSCHCYRRECRDFIAISGSSLLLAAIAPVHLDPIGCQEFLHSGVIYEERTLYTEVHKLQPATVFRFGAGSSKRHERYWQVSELQPEYFDVDQAAEKLWHVLSSALLRIGREFRSPVCDLTGGYDSRAMVAAFLDSSRRFSTVVTGALDNPDVRVSSTLAKLANLPHIRVSRADALSFSEIKEGLAVTDGEYNLVEYASILRTHRQLAQQFDISLNGSFGELARGYWWELLFPYTGCRRALDARKIARARFAAKRFDASLFSAPTALDMTAHFEGVITRNNVGLEELPNTLQLDNVYLLMRMQRWQGRIASSTNQLWPCLSPFMFRSVMEVILQTRSEARRRSLLIRSMLARFQPQLANVPLEHGYPAVPLNWKNWYRFWPLAEYYGLRLWQKAGVARSQGASIMGPTATPLRLRLWTEPEVNELLLASTMRVGALLDQARLHVYLNASKKAEFPWEEQWMRLLTLECALHALQRGGGSILT